jgi:hypothetical protein
MNVLNRILVVLAVLVVLVVCVAVFVAPIPILDAASGWMEEAASSLDALEGLYELLRIVIGIVLALIWLVICVLFLVLELFPRRRKMVRVEKIDSGEVEVSLRTVREHVIYAVDRMPGVLRARPSVAARKGGVVVEVEVDIAGDLDVPPQATRIVEMVRRVVEEKVGVKLARPPKVRLRATSAPLTARRGVEGRFREIRQVEPAMRRFEPRPEPPPPPPLPEVAEIEEREEKEEKQGEEEE